MSADPVTDAQAAREARALRAARRAVLAVLLKYPVGHVTVPETDVEYAPLSEAERATLETNAYVVRRVADVLLRDGSVRVPTLRAIIRTARGAAGPSRRP